MMMMMQIDAHYDEQKELIQRQLVMEQQMISDVDRLYSVSETLALSLFYVYNRSWIKLYFSMRILS